MYIYIYIYMCRERERERERARERLTVNSFRVCTRAPFVYKPSVKKGCGVICWSDPSRRLE